MLSQNILKILKENNPFKDFFLDCKDFEVLIKKLSIDDIQRINKISPDFLKPKSEVHKDNNIDFIFKKNISSIICLTLVRNDLKKKKYDKLRKIKIYFDESSEKIIKILQN